jgi:hypothetical protein
VRVFRDEPGWGSCARIEEKGEVLSDSKARKGAVAAALRRITLGSLVVAGLWLVAAPGASAAGAPVKIGSPLSSGPPAITVDHAGDAVIAWANTKDLAGANNFVQYCVLPPNATACSHSGSLIPADSAQFIDGVQVLDEGSTLLILADVFGAQGDSSGDFTPEQEWQSTDGGATWVSVNGGLSVTSGILNADTQPLSAVTVPGTGVLGYGWDTAAGVPTFNAFPLASPPECSVARCPAGFASLEPVTNPDALSNEPGQFASIPNGSLAGVMGVFETLFTNGPLGCAQDFGTAYVYGSGSQSATNSYNISPGRPNSAWKVPLSQVDCNTEYAAVAGGPSGFGILEDGLSGHTIYHRFDASTRRFDTPQVVVADQGEQQATLSQDGGGGIYATYLLGGVGGPVKLSYSGDGGSAWSSGTLDRDSDGGVGSLNSSVNAARQGWATWVDNGTVFAQPFKAADAIEPARVGGGATTNGTTITVNVSCATFPCTITITLTAPETVVVHASSASLALGKPKKSKKGKTVTLGKGRFTLKSKGQHQLTVKLSPEGRRFVRSHSGHVKIGAKVAELHGKVTTRKLELKIPKSAKHHKK